MLPGFRFLFAAIVLSMSILIFGLGAASLLRAAHQQFVSIPSRPTPPETVFAQQTEAANPTLAMLRVDAPASDNATEHAPVAATSNEQASIGSTTIESDKTTIAPPAAAAAQSDTPQNNAAAPDEPALATGIKTASTEAPVSPANEAAAPAIEPTSPAALPSADAASPKVAALGDAPVTSEQKAKPADAPTKSSAAKSSDAKSSEAKHLKARRRLARRRTRLARQTTQTSQQLATDPFTQQQITQQVTPSTPAPVVRTR